VFLTIESQKEGFSSMSDPVNELIEVLEKIRGTGSFHSSGDADFFLPQMTVEGVGELAFPMPELQAKALAAVAADAPYGRGEETVHDPEVRRCYEIDAELVTFASDQWDSFLEDVARKAGTRVWFY
jgi:hypothetical protein